MYQFKPIRDRIKIQHDKVRYRTIVFDAERTNILTEAWQNRIEKMPPLIRTAEGLYELCSKVTCPVEDFELIVGSIGRGFSGVGFNPEWRNAWPVDAARSGRFKLDETDGLYHSGPDELFKMAIAPQDVDDLEKAAAYWKGRQIGDTSAAWRPPYFDELRDSDCSDYKTNNLMSTPCGHIAPGHKKIVDKGYEAIRKEAQDWLDAHYGNTMGEDADKYVFYTAAARTAEAGSILCYRYGESCEAKAAEEKDPKRKEELLMMADGLKWISKNPARTFWEALQATMMYEVLIMLECSPPALALGRLDQITWPYLKKDLETGRITLDDAQEMVDAFILKAECFYKGGIGKMATSAGIGNTYQHTTIGGCDPKTGKDATNPVTYMILETMGRMKLHDPTISLRITRDTPKDLWECAFATAKNVGGMPLFQNDDIIIPTCQKQLGFSLEDARNYCFIGCQEIVSSGADYPAPAGVHPPHTGIHYSKILDMALNNGINPKNKFQSKIHTGYLYEMNSIEDVKAAFEKLVRYYLTMYVSIQNYCEYLNKYIAPHPSMSISIEGCMENGKDCTQGGAKYNSYGGTATGFATVADSLSTIQYMCFDKKLCTTRELYDAYMANWEGYEDLLAVINREVPHYGNNNPYADQYFNWVVNLYHDVCSTCYSTRSKVYRSGMYGASDHVMQGYETWATPDGRKFGTPIADAASPAQGRDKNGPTGVFNSCLCYDHTMFAGGMAVNLKISPSSLKTDEDVEKLATLTDTYFKNGGMEVQYNIVSAATMIAAQAKPEEYQDLVVRIAGYSAYFTELSKDCQDDIISRTENVL